MGPAEAGSSCKWSRNTIVYKDIEWKMYRNLNDLVYLCL